VRGSTVRTDGWAIYQELPKLGYRHEPLVIGDDMAKADAHLPMIHLVFSNEDMDYGNHHGAIAQHHLQAYLNEYVFRFNRRFYPMTAFNSVLGLCRSQRAARLMRRSTPGTGSPRLVK